MYTNNTPKNKTPKNNRLNKKKEWPENCPWPNVHTNDCFWEAEDADFMPLDEDGLDWGCNHMSVEIGANPRDDDMENVKWYPFPPEQAKEMMIRRGFEIGTIDDFMHIMPYDL